MTSFVCSYELVVLELKPKHPSRAVCVVECDLELDFAPPLDYVEPPKDYGNGPVAAGAGAPVGTPLPTKVRSLLYLPSPYPCKQVF